MWHHDLLVVDQQCQYRPCRSHRLRRRGRHHHRRRHQRRRRHHHPLRPRAHRECGIRAGARLRKKTMEFISGWLMIYEPPSVLLSFALHV